MAVGVYLNRAGRQVAFSERWDGTGWTTQRTRSPRRAKATFLRGVACRSATRCTAVGQYKSEAGEQIALTERWNGRVWTVDPSPKLPGSLSSYLNGVACPTATTCTAVGQYLSAAGRTQGLVERWDGAAWVVVPVPGPGGAKNASLNSVACASPTACVAVGWYLPHRGPGVSLAERWDGKAWAIQPTPNPAGAGSTGFGSVDCATATRCIAVGGYSDAAGLGFTLAERWNGTEWLTQQPSPNPAGADESVLNAVACPTAEACHAVGWLTKRSVNRQSLAERWDGIAWLLSLPSGGGSP
jgi:hypothetical protein